MEKFGKAVVKLRIPILIASIVLLIPSVFSYLNTRVNYDILSYLPSELETVKGQDILLDEFGVGAFSTAVIEGMTDSEIVDLTEKIEEVEHVKQVVGYNTVAELDIPLEILPERISERISDADADSALVFILYDDSMSSDETLAALKEIKSVTAGQCFISGMTAVISDTRELTEQEEPIYVIIAVVLALIVLAITMEHFLIPFIFILSIGFAIIYNLGSNFAFGEISYITQALAAVLQLGVTMDYSIFLWHSYQDEKASCGDNKEAMGHAIAKTFTSVVSSSITTVAGFIALCFMSFTLGLDLGIVMAKGVVIGVICCVTVLPSIILTLDKLIEKTRHRNILPDFKFISKFVKKRFKLVIIIFAIILVPAIYGYTHTEVYYDLVGTLPETLDSKVATEKLDEQYDMTATHIVIFDSTMSQVQKAKMMEDIGEVEGVTMTLGIESLVGATFPTELLPDELLSEFENETHEMMLISSEYDVASDAMNRQCDEINAIIKNYDANAMLIGEAPCTKDLIETTAVDFAVVSSISIVAIFIIILLVFRSISLPVILVAAIEFAIFINLGIPAFTNTTLPFIASIVIGTIQLGSTVDYAILMTTRYKRERSQGVAKTEAVEIAVKASAQSIVVSAVSFFASTIGVGIYSNVDMISALCLLMARGALISMAVVLFVLPSLFMVFDKVIAKTTIGFLPKGEKVRFFNKAGKQEV